MPAMVGKDDMHLARPPLEQALAHALLDHALPGERDGLNDIRLGEIAAFVTDAVRNRLPLTPVIRFGSGGIHGGKRLSWLVVNTDDMPFLVDSVAAAITAHGFAIERLLHPVINASRRANGELVAVGVDQSAGNTDNKQESLIFIEMEHANARNRALIANEIGAALKDVRQAVIDWRPMLDRLNKDVAGIADSGTRAFLNWLAADNFTFLGHSEINIDETITGNNLGQLKNGGPASLLENAASIRAALEKLQNAELPLLIAKADRQSRVHRRSRMDVVAVPLRDATGHLHGISAYAGLFTSQALAAPADSIPILAERVSSLAASLGFTPNGHAAKALNHVIAELPRDLLLEMDDATLRDIALTAMSLIDRPRPKAKTVRDPLGRYTTLLIWLPRDDYSSQRRSDIAALASNQVDGAVDSWTAMLGENPLISLRYVVRHARNRTMDPALLDTQLQKIIRGWNHAVEAALSPFHSAPRASRLALTYANAFSQSYRSQFSPEEAAQDIQRLNGLSDAQDRDGRLYRQPGDAEHQIRLKIYRLHEIIPLSDAVPVLENFGFRVIEEYPFDLETRNRGWIHDFLLESLSGPIDPAGITPVLEPAIRAVLTCKSENDPFNALIVRAGLDAFAIHLLRAWFRYLRQTGSIYGLQTIADALTRHPGLAHALIDLFRAMHDPAHPEMTRTDAIATLDSQIKSALAQVSAIDDDDILRRLLAIIHATLRTNAFVPDGEDTLAIKLDSRAIPGLPAPVPWREIFVYSTRVEGIHLRGGPIARGGIRWSDRRDDFRTEILGLIKAQMVKNAVIVPTGAKGGFYAKQLPPPASRDAWLAEGTEAYRVYIRALLSVTDNIVDGKVVHPDHVVIRDGDDPYFVVAADKGTASFSDLANAIALEHRFWLGDAFASGGSNGYDHKEMGITARGAWISVKRHFVELGLDADQDPITVAGVGDMSGDVFGNGMLLSKAIRLIAAFDHRHIFIDPNPDPAISWAERKRLFELPRSSWADYEAGLLSKGGGVFPRTQKEIALSPEARVLLDIDADSIGPSALIAAILKARVDLLWFGGIGTYIKGAHETNAQVGDRANDAHRVDGRSIRARVVGEGANLGVTQAGRVEYAMQRGRIDTDFIDNSAGVDCSDNEVNIKIALNAEMTAGHLGLEARNTLLHAMTDAVAALVLEDNRLQTLALSLAERGGNKALPSYQRVIQTLEASGSLNRAVEGLPDDEQLNTRIRDGLGLLRPELAVLLAYAKLALQHAIEHGDYADDPLLEPTLLAAFPPPMVERFAPAIRSHRLKREIIATKLANRLINRNGIIMPFALAEEEGCTLAQIAAAYATAEALFGLPGLWQAIEDAPVSAATELALLDVTATATRLHVADMVRTMPSDAAPATLYARLSAGIARIGANLDDLLRDNSRTQRDALRKHLLTLDAPAMLVDRIVSLRLLDGAIGIADLAVTLGDKGNEIALALAYTRLGEALGLDWAKDAALALDPADPWERLLVSGLVRDFEQFRLDLLGRIVAAGEAPQPAIEHWLTANAHRVDPFHALVARARAQSVMTPTILAQIASQARTLLNR